MSVLGYDPVEEGPSLRRLTGVLTESPSLDDKLSAQETLTIYGRLYGVDETTIQARAAELLETFDLGARAVEPVGTFSKGMRQRLALARALLHDPRLIFLDEPTAGLDPVGAESVRRLIVRLTEEKRRTVILCTHNLMEAQRLCHRVGVLEHGQLVALGTPSGLARDLQQGVRLCIEMDSCDPEALSLPEAAREITWDPETQVLQLRLPHREDIPALVASLVDARHRIYRVSPEEPTLEDVYFALHNAHERTGKKVVV
jgi:ABC-2 type transport system ATP-binding protein